MADTAGGAALRDALAGLLSREATARQIAELIVADALDGDAKIGDRLKIFETGVKLQDAAKEAAPAAAVPDWEDLSGCDDARLRAMLAELEAAEGG